MKKLLNGILTAALLTGSLLSAGCEKKEADNGGGGDENTFAGTYSMSAKPLYSDMNAADPTATAIEMEGMNMTYAEVITVAYAVIPNQTLSDFPMEITFNADGTMKIVEKTPTGDDTLFPDEQDGISSKDMTYAINGNNLVLSLSSAAIDDMIDDETKGPEFTAAVKSILAKFTKGIVVYSAADNTAEVNLRYVLTGKELSIYIDQSLLQETWSVAQGAMEEISALVGQSNPDLLPLLSAVLPQVGKMLDTGFTKIEVGAHLAKK